MGRKRDKQKDKHDLVGECLASGGVERESEAAWKQESSCKAAVGSLYSISPFTVVVVVLHYNSYMHEILVASR